MDTSVGTPTQTWGVRQGYAPISRHEDKAINVHIERYACVCVEGYCSHMNETRKVK